MIFVFPTVVLWFAMILYWFFAAKRSSQSGLKSELIPLFKLVGSALVIYLPLLTGGWLATHAYRADSGINIIGIVICATGVILAVWARHTLGKNWSGKVMVQHEHRLIEQGPYRLIRHPIYTGVLLAMIGATLTLTYVFSFVYIALSVFGLVRKSKQEEALLIRQFPRQYSKYRERAKMLIPFIY